MDNEKVVSLRMGVEDLQLMDDYLEDHPELGKSRSLFIRNAVREYIDRDADVAKSDKNGLFVPYTSAEMMAMKTMVDKGSYLSEAEFVRNATREYLMPKPVAIEKASAAMNMASSDVMTK
jgi:Arc/MetJ-type ribon-helix-helix transcriptional regulator